MQPFKLRLWREHAIAGFDGGFGRCVVLVGIPLAKLAGDSSILRDERRNEVDPAKRVLTPRAGILQISRWPLSFLGHPLP